MSGSGGGDSSPRRCGGSGPGGGFGGGPGGGSGDVDCSQVRFTTTLGSPDPAVVATVNMGELCDVFLLQNPTRILVMTRPNGAVLGAITDRWEDLVRCIGKGTQFVAEVFSTTSPVKVMIRPL